MAEFRGKSLCILGRQSQLGLAELESLYGARHIRKLNDAALLDIDTKDIAFKRLGGTQKLAQVLQILPTTNWQDILQFLIEKIPEHMKFQPPGKFTLGLSIYGLPISLNEQTKGLMAIKRTVRSSGKAIRIVPNKAAVLNSAQVLHNKLTTKGAWELLLIRNGRQTILAQTIVVQDIEAYSARDQERPARDARVGMLPPKLAQIMINLIDLPKDSVILDPFCGSGVVLQEALLMGYKVVGTDLDARMVDFATQNIKWLLNKYPNLPSAYAIGKGDAATYQWPKKIDGVVSEIYLGKPLSKPPASEDLYKIAGEVNELFKKFLTNARSQLKPGMKLCLGVPAWRTKNGFVQLPILDNLLGLGYNQLDFEYVASKDLVYFRPGQIVARKLIVLEKQ